MNTSPVTVTVEKNINRCHLHHERKAGRFLACSR
ncbi:hypothetical protein M1D86_15735 [Bacillus sp. PK3-137]